jgi:TPR repeat protein
VTKNYEEAVRRYRSAAEQGDTEAQYTMGINYSTGKGVAKNDEEAARRYRLAAEQGHASAQRMLE